ncbi:FGGY-family carbohydrate kinase [Ideonella sp. DXS29W]|uniref:FGGY-family carbohydrate kinase n=1 Tax=Ideonella lacteola TaxID=2984193 RepID=A0ABU9BP00_9BURK
MNLDPWMLSLDLGTQSVRALLIDLRGEVRGKAQLAFDQYVSLQEGWHEHDAETFWQAAASVCRRVLQAHAHDHAAERVQGLTVTTQRGTLVPIDAAGQPLRRFITWLDQRRASRLPRINPGWWLAFRAARVDETIDYFQREAELNWMAEHEPDLLARTHKVLLVSGWLNYRLTGRYADSTASQVGYLPFDFKRQQWASARDWKWQALHVRREWLPELVPPGTTLGGLTPDAAEATGLRVGLPVIAAAADKACEIVGAGAIEPHIGALSYGTTATIDVTTPRYVEALPFLPPYPALLPGHYNTEVQIFRGYWLVRWFKEQFGHPEVAEATGAGVSVEPLFDRLVAQVPPGSQGLMLQPYWTPGIRHPGPEARGAVIGFSDVHTRAHLYRAILEGLGYALREGCVRIQQRSGTTVTTLRVSGGGAQSDAAMQLTADIFGLPAARPHTFETSGLGAAIAGAVGLGLYADFPSAVAGMTRLGSSFEPHPGHQALYDALYHGVYRRMYGRLAPLYDQLRRILPASA